MPFYRLTRHVIYRPGTQETHEVWGIDRVPAALPTIRSPTFTDEDDPLRRCDCAPLLVMKNGDYVTWHRFFEWLSEANGAGYTLKTGLDNVSPLTTFVIEGP